MVERAELSKYIRGDTPDIIKSSETEIEPFRIRGHRLPNLRSLLEKYESGNTEIRTSNSEKFTKVIEEYPAPSYGRDFLGYGINRRERTRARIQRYDEIFLNLPDDYPTLVTGAAPDTFCLSVPTIGLHCRSINCQKFGLTKDAIAEDKINYEIFTDYAKKQGDVTEPTNEWINFSDTLRGFYIPTYKTNLGAVKTFLRSDIPLII